MNARGVTTEDHDLNWLRRLFGAGPEAEKAHDGFINSLEAAGFFSHAPPSEVEEIRGELRRLGWPGIFAHSGRFHHADAEELAEGGVAGFLDSVGPFLESEGVALGVIQEDSSADHYTLHVAGRDWVIYDEGAVARDANEPGVLWARASLNAFTLVNELLRDAGSLEHLYAVNGGNDLFGMFLTEGQLTVVRQHAGGSIRGTPYELRDDPPWYGEPRD